MILYELVPNYGIGRVKSYTLLSRGNKRNVYCVIK